MPKVPTRREVLAARTVALAADALQIVLLPLFAGGAPEGFDAVLDVAVGAVLCWLCGFHLAFVPTFVGEALPTVDLFPTWTLAVLYVTRQKRDGALPARTD